jgi:hypothetical protein
MPLPIGRESSWSLRRSDIIIGGSGANGGGRRYSLIPNIATAVVIRHDGQLDSLFQSCVGLPTSSRVICVVSFIDLIASVRRPELTGPVWA